MEVFAVIVGLGLAGYILVSPILALVKSAAAKRLARQNQNQQQKLIQRVDDLEKQLQEFRSQLENVDLKQASEFSPTSARRQPAATVAPQPPAGIEAHAPESLRPAAGPSQAPTPPVAPLAATPPAKIFEDESAAPPSDAASMPPPHFEAPAAPKPASREAVKRVLNIEEVLGTNWLNKLGVIGIVIGMALIMAHEMGQLGPAGRVLAGFAVGAAFLGAGVFYERRERWRILARAGMGGGWALLYFTTYAMNHIAAARVLNSEPLDFVLLMIVAAAMLAHTLRYDSRVITGLAFLLAFSTINISRAGPASLFAGAILATALVVIVVKRRWFDVEVLAIAAIYLNHYYWLTPIIEPMGEHHHAFPEFMPSAVLLIFMHRPAMWPVFGWRSTREWRKRLISRRAPA